MTECRRSGVAVICATEYGAPWREGVANLTRRLVADFRNEGLRVTVITRRSLVHPDEWTGEFGEDVVPVAEASARWGRLLFWGQTGLVLRRRRRELGSVLVLASGRSSLPVRLAFLRLAAGRPLVAWVTGLAQRPRRTSKLCAASHTFVISPFLQRWYPDADVAAAVLPHSLVGTGVDRHRPPGSGFRLLYLGAMEPARGVESMLAAFTIARTRARTPITLAIAWNGHGSYSRDDVTRLLAPLLNAGWASLDEVVDLQEAYGGCDAVVIPRLNEIRMAMPLRLLEALHMHKPVVVTDACDMGALLRGAGVAVRRGDAHDMADAFVRLADDDAFYRQCVQRCSEAAQWYDDQNTLGRLRAVVGRNIDAAARA